jgi:thioredoxin-related protein
MVLNKFFISAVTLLVISCSVSCAQSAKNKTDNVNNVSNKKNNEIHWLSFTEAVEANKKQKKKILIDVYTDWCGWCKKMDASTYQNPKLIDYVNKNYYPVKLDAEMSDSVVFNNHTFKKTDPAKKSAPHELAIALLNGKMGYPSTVFLDENFNMLTPVQGYLTVEQLEMYLRYFNEADYKSNQWDEFQNSFKSQFIE